MLALNDLTFAYPGQTEPYRFALELGAGETLGISGKSGSGKSTLLDLIAGFLEPASGTIILNGQNLTGLPPQERPVSILFQDDNLFDHLSVGKNLSLGLPAKMPRTERQTRIENALSQVGLSGYGPRRAASLSGGQKQRTSLARTLLRNNPVLLLDEPFTALDSEAAQDMRALVKRLTQEHQWHVVLVSHDPDDIEALATQHKRVADLTLQNP